MPLSLLVARQSFCKGILSIASGQTTLGGQFSLRCLLSLRSRRRLGLQSSNERQSFILGQTLVSQLCLKIANHYLRLRQRSLSTFSRCCFRSDGPPGSVELVGAVFSVRLVIPAKDGDRHLAVANKSMPLRL